MIAADLERNARKFLDAWGISFDDLVAWSPQVGADETLLLCSTIPEGLANQTSDIDLIYVGGGELRGDVKMEFRPQVQIDVGFDGNGREYNVKKVGEGELQSLARALSSSINLIENPYNVDFSTLIIERNIYRLTLAHRIKNAVCLINPHVYRKWYDRLLLDKLHLHLCLQEMADFKNFEEDLAGELAEGHLESAIWIAKEVMAKRLLGALLYSSGCTNVSIKWHGKLLQRHSEEVGAEHVRNLLAFMWSKPPETAMQVEKIVEQLFRPIERSIFDRLPKIRRAVRRFSSAVRYQSVQTALRAREATDRP